jgi:hypothetical protein
LYRLFDELCERYGIAPRIPQYTPQTVQQLTLF